MSQFTGIIKSFNPRNGWGFIQCEETEKKYGKDIIVLKRMADAIINPGDEVTFSVQQGEKGPEAVGITVHSHGHFPEPKAAERKKGWYVGNVKSYNPDKGWGFIACIATHEIYDKDIFLMHTREKQVKVKAGDRVRFTVKQGDKGPEADKVQVINSAGKVLQNAGDSFVTDGNIYTGKIKSFNENRGWGFIKCAETEAAYGKDILVHKDNVGTINFRVGEEVRFAVHEGEKGPEAVDVKRKTAGGKKVTDDMWSAKGGGYGPVVMIGKGGKGKSKGKAKAAAMAAYEATLAAYGYGAWPY